ncbi:hypothetical protein Pst134EA_024400 [Puccinia striiformis f. sp. tritici]|uniref:hypothetical protein n=1 Tax=Puccinia striiformis f. sp. tritici TaxID=168172 RepID=UPI0020085111|nr:hypothetical protein Pst134EA_024400 [Puccinia striiformis f. sp. tritici]KAH9453529.1 hypothetical protein Pst134EA_024400 [Puccinia striiformis f. sp. tritici]
MSEYSDDLDMISSKRNPQMPITPPHSIRSKFVVFPLTPRTGQPEAGSSRDTNEEVPKSDEVSGEMEEDDDENYSDGEEEQETFTQSEMLIGSTYDGLSTGTRESEEEAFTSEDDIYALIEPDVVRETVTTMGELTGSITDALNQYRTQFNTWEDLPSPPASAVRASTLLDQGLARFVYNLEPLKFLVHQISALSNLLADFGNFLSRSNFDPRNTVAFTQLWNGLYRLTDDLIQVEEGLRHGTTEVAELLTWTDGTLTPSLAEVKFSSKEEDHKVSEILDVHAYLCDSLGKVKSIFSIYRSSIKHISRAIESLQSSSINPTNLITFPIDETALWAKNAAIFLSAASNSILVFSSISDSVQVHTLGGRTSLSNVDVRFPATRFPHAISY